jgi:hypothetical protein
METTPRLLALGMIAKAYLQSISLIQCVQIQVNRINVSCFKGANRRVRPHSRVFELQRHTLPSFATTSDQPCRCCHLRCLEAAPPPGWIGYRSHATIPTASDSSGEDSTRRTNQASLPRHDFRSLAFTHIAFRHLPSAVIRSNMTAR